MVVFFWFRGLPIASVFHGEADFEGHLPAMDFSLFDVAARFDHLKPAQVLDGFVRPFDGVFHGILNGSGGGAGKFDEFIDGIFHRRFWVGKNVQSSQNLVFKATARPIIVSASNVRIILVFMIFSFCCLLLIAADTAAKMFPLLQSG
jgi:hypothetical protein